MIECLMEILSRKLLIHEVYFSIQDSNKFTSETICAIYMPQFNVIVLNRDWLIKAVATDIIYVIAHEMRHAYQYLLTINQLNYFNITESMIKNWKLEFDDYIMPDDSYNRNYEQQEIEIDAHKYAEEFSKNMKLGF